MAGSPDPKPVRESRPDERALSLRWYRLVREKWLGEWMDVEAHHVVFQQVCRRRARELGLPEAQLVWDERNGMPLPRERHARFHRGSQVIWIDELPPAALEFAREYGLEWWLERRYP
jgi:hypothetical protein